jgi:hypothetical protein
MIIHTTMPIAELRTLVGDRGVVTLSTAIRTGGPDCFAGWREPADKPDCLPNNIVTVDSPDVAEIIALDLMNAFHQVVVTKVDDDGNDVVDEEMPIRYQMNHTH